MPVAGSVVPAASIQLTNTQTGVTLTSTTNEAGLYRFLFLNPGRYKVVATIVGFKTFERDNIQLTVNESATLPITLEVGAQTDRITITAEAPLVESEKADRGLLIDNKKVVDLPINTRNPIMLAALVTIGVALGGSVYAGMLVLLRTSEVQVLRAMARERIAARLGRT